MSEHRRKILIVSHDLSLSGAPAGLLNIVGELREQYEFTVVASEDGGLRIGFEELGVPVEVDPMVMHDLSATTKRLPNYDLLFANTLLCHAPVVAAALAGRPSVWALHEVESWKWLFDKCQPGIGAAMNLATTLLVTCQYAANMYNTWQPRDMRVIYHGVKLRPLPPPKPPGSRPLKVLLLASIHPRKGQDIGIEAMKKIGDKGIQLDIVGIVVDLKFCSKLLDMTHGFPPVRWIGEVPAGADIDAIAEADIVIVPSRDDVTPMVIAEAMGMGKPVIAANIGGIPEMVQDGETGLLMEKEDSSKLAELIEMLAGDEGLRRTYGERGREFIKNHRTIEVFGREVGKMIEETLAAFED